MITLKNINKYYMSGTEKYHALRNINFTFPDTGMVFIVGKSGSGKSTLLNTIGGIDSYDSGDLIIDGTSTSKYTKADYNTYRNSYTGFIFQEFNVVKNLNVYDNISLSLRLLNKNIQDNHEFILETIKSVGLEGKEKRKMNQLSGGERQRVAIARALVKQPKVIIADEPTGNLDKNNRDTVMNILKELSKERLVIVVTHDKSLSRTYGDEEIKLKDGAIVNHTLFKKNSIEPKETSVETPFVKPSLKAPLFLSLKSLKQNLFRFIMITLFFTVALVFANTTINLYYSNATKEYATYQQDYHNEYISISDQQTIYGKKVQSGFFQVDTLSYKNLVNSFNNDTNEKSYKIYPCYSINIPINQNADEFIDYFYSSKIANVVVIEDINEFSKDHPITYTDSLEYRPMTCYITDYLALSLIANNYFNDNASFDVNYELYFADKYLTVDGLHYPIYISGIIETNYTQFLDLSLNDPNVYASFIDNQIFYNSIYFTKSKYVGSEDGSQFVSTTNMKYVYDDFVYSGIGQEGVIENVKVSYYSDECNILKGTSPKLQPEGEYLDQIVVSTAFLKEAYGLTPDEVNLGTPEKPISMINPITGTTASFNFYGYRRISSSFYCEIVGIVESDEPTIYFCNPTITKLYYNYLKISFSDYDNSTETFGGRMIVKITDDINKNIGLYQAFRNNNIIIDNLSYTKLQVVNEFIDNNLILFLGLFFALCMFSVLMIFNFVVITIKNSTKDIGIYMSLGMSGKQISLIFIFQIILISTITFILSTAGAIIFLNLLDSSLSLDTSTIINEVYNISIKPIDFEIFKINAYGILISFGIAYVIPILAVLIPLFRLARKKPIDILKVS